MSPNPNGLSNNILYRANITLMDENSKTKVCYGICETTFKLRHANHKKLFNHRIRKSDSGISNEFWKIKDNNCSAHITWEILGRNHAYNTSSKRYSLCLHGKLKRALHKTSNMLNKRTEILVFTKCFAQNHCFSNLADFSFLKTYQITEQTNFL